MRRQLVICGKQPPKENNLAAIRPLDSRSEILRNLFFTLREIASTPHRVHEIIGHFDILRKRDRMVIKSNSTIESALAFFQTLPPAISADPSQPPENIVSGREQLRKQARPRD
jgi:hypothetical protein